MVCPTPALIEIQKYTSRMKKGLVREKRKTHDTGSIQVEIIIHLDGVRKPFTLSYFSDPEFQRFDEEVKLFESHQNRLTIKVSMKSSQRLVTRSKFTVFKFEFKADNSHEMSSLIFSKIQRINIPFAAVVISSFKC